LCTGAIYDARYVTDIDDVLDGLPLFQPSCHIGLTDRADEVIE
jgi:hypothetical protein